MHLFNDAPRLGARSLLIAAAFGLAVAAFHLWQGAPLAHSVLMQSFNWVYDFDSSRFVGGWCTPGADVAQDMDIAFVARHLLSLATRPLCLGLNLVIGNPALSLMALTALCAGLAASLAYALAAAFCAREFDRLLLALGYAVSVHPLMMGVIPETYGWALMGVGLHMTLRAQRRDRAPDAGAWSVFSLFLDLGITVTNAALNLLSSAVLSWRRMSRQRWLQMEARTWLLACLLLALVVVPAAALYAPSVLAEAGGAPKRVWWIVNINRGEPASLAMVICSFVLYSFVAPAFTVLQLPAPDLHPMLDFRQFSYGVVGGAALALWALAMTTSVVLVWRDRALRPLLLVAGLALDAHRAALVLAVPRQRLPLRYPHQFCAVRGAGNGLCLRPAPLPARAGARRGRGHAGAGGRQQPGPVCGNDRFPAEATAPSLTMIDDPTPAEVATLSRQLYTNGPVVARAMQHYRPYISPFGLLMRLVPPGSRVLDIGCGGGLFLGLLARAGRIRRGLGIDTSQRAIAVANEMTTRLPAGHGVRFEARSASVPLPAEGYDVVSLLDVMHHIPPEHQRLVLEQALDRVEAGGRFIYKDMALRPFWRALANRLHDLLIARQWIHYLPLAQAIAWAEAKGCTVIEQRRVDMLWYGHEVVVFSMPQAGLANR